MSIVALKSRVASNPFGTIASYQGFRLFFIGASAFSCIAMTTWLFVTKGYFVPELRYFSSSQWHAHEMLYGYTLAVVAGFLLTAVENWTGYRTLRGYWLLLPFIPWLIARSSILGGDQYILVSAISDLTFLIIVLISVARPIVAAGQWKQIGILSKLLGLGIGNGIFYLDALANIDDGARISQTIGVYVLVALILTIGFRVLPRFIAVALNLTSPVEGDLKGTLVTLILFVLLFSNHLIQGRELLNAVVAFPLFVCVTYRLFKLYDRRIFAKSLLWGLYASIIAIDLGFLIEAIIPWYSPLPNLHIHAYSVGGIGLSTLSMMSRVSLGHTGQSIFVPPPLTGIVIGLIGVALCFRVLLPFFIPLTYPYALLGAQISWILAFIGFLAIFIRHLTLSQRDGMGG